MSGEGPLQLQCIQRSSAAADHFKTVRFSRARDAGKYSRIGRADEKSGGRRTARRQSLQDAETVRFDIIDRNRGYRRATNGQHLIEGPLRVRFDPLTAEFPCDAAQRAPRFRVLTQNQQKIIQDGLHRPSPGAMTIGLRRSSMN